MFTHIQGAVADQAQGVGAGDAELGEGRGLKDQLAIGPLFQVGPPEGLHNLAENQCPVDAGVLDKYGLSVICHRSGVRESGTFDDAAIVIRLVNISVLFQSVQGNNPVRITLIRSGSGANQIVQVAYEEGSWAVGALGLDGQTVRHCNRPRLLRRGLPWPQPVLAQRSPVLRWVQQ